MIEPHSWHGGASAWRDEDVALALGEGGGGLRLAASLGVDLGAIVEVVAVGRVETAALAGCSSFGRNCSAIQRKT